MRAAAIQLQSWKIPYRAFAMYHLKRALMLAPAAILAALVVRMPLAAQSRRRVVRASRGGQTWTARPTAQGLGDNDITAGEDPVIRAAALKAIGDLNGTAVVVDPNSGRILAMVNQGLAVSADYQPCSTTKMAVALAALRHQVVTENTPIQVAAHFSVNMTEALAYSINAYFEALGDKMGFATVAGFDREMGLGTRAGWDIPGEDPGLVPDEPGPGGVAKLSSYGEGVHISPLQLAAIVTAIANGGTLYYLQHPTSPAQVQDFVPRVKRELPIAALTPEVKDGMMAAVQYGTAKLAHLRDEAILGKTGTCSRDGTRYGLFASYLGNPTPKLVVVVVLRGGRTVYGPRAAQVAGVIYRALDRHHFFKTASRRSAVAPFRLIARPRG
ncbi:MAG: penicillin-binding transpeptidase domain-containing protein [Terriglobales bacterium]